MYGCSRRPTISSSTASISSSMITARERIVLNPESSSMTLATSRRWRACLMPAISM
jgi:hypothetical protein